VTLALIVTSPFSVAPLDGAVMQVWIVDELTFVVTHGWFWASRSSRSTTWPGAAPAGWLTKSMQPIRNNLSHSGKRCVRTAVRKLGGELMPYLTDRLLVPSHRSFGASSHSWIRRPGPGEWILIAPGVRAPDGVVPAAHGQPTSSSTYASSEAL